jgi:hypothetical protein
MFQETDRKFQEMKQQSAKEMKELRQELGGIGRSQGEVAEHYFYSAIKRNMKLLHVELNEIEFNVNKYIKSLNVREQYDMVLTNTNVIVIVEVKYKMRTKDVMEFHDRKIPNYKILFPHNKDYKLYGAVASFTFEPDAIELAKEYGYIVLTRVGKHLEVLNENTRTY